MNQPDQSRIDAAIKSAQQKHSVGETSDEIRTELEEAFALANVEHGTRHLEHGTWNMEHGTTVARIHASIATHFMIRGQLDAAIQQCNEALKLIGGSNTPLEIDVLVLQSRQYLANNVEKARELTDKAMSLSMQIFGHASAPVLLRHAEVVGAEGDIDEAIALLRRAEAMFELDGDSSGRLLALLRLCVQLTNSNQHGLVIEYATEAITLAKELDRRMAQLNSFKFLAMGLTALNRPAEAYEVARRALEIAETHFPGHLVGDCTGVLGDVYLQLKDMKTALSCFAKALAVYRETGHKNGQAFSLLRMGEVYGVAGQAEQAEKLLKEADEIANEIGHKVLKRSIAVARAGLYMRETNDHHKPPKEAIDKAVDLFRRIADSTTSQSLPMPDEIDISILSAPAPLMEQLTIGEAEAVRNIHVTMLGSFHVKRNGVEITLEEWKRKKARDVFKYLVAKHKRSVNAEEIVLNVWGENMDLEKCLPTLQNAISSIRAALEPHLKPRQKSTFLHFRDGSYLLDFGEHAHIDVDEFVHAAKSALDIIEPSKRMEALAHAAELYTGEMLPDDVYYDWTDFVRSTTKDLAVEVLDQLAASQFALGMDAAARVTMHRSAALSGD